MRQLIVKLWLPIARWFYNNTLLQTYEGIKICELANSSASEKEQHLGYLIQAIDLIKTHDPRRFHRIQKRLQYIVNRVCIGSGEYRHELRACIVDLTQFEFEVNEDHYIVQLACTLIHEATHGEIQAHNIAYGKQNFSRIERICDQEEKRFLARIKNEASGDKFDKTWYEDYQKLNSWQRVTKVVKRIR